MKYIFSTFLLLIIFLCYLSVNSTSIVYNFRIAQITKPRFFEKENNKDYTLLALVFDQYRKKQTSIYQRFLGEFSSFIYDFKSYYIRTDFAFSNIREHKLGISNFSDTETDDILISAGRNFLLNPQTVITYSGLVGLPTHKIFRLQHTDFGYSQFATGAQMDGSYAFSLEYKNFILAGIRYIHFFPRSASDAQGKKYTFTIGNMADIFISQKNNLLQHGFEYGYTAKFRFSAHITPFLADIVEKTNYIRSNFFAVYRYKFLIREVANKIFFNIAYGFDHIPKRFGNKYIVTLWASWNINF